MSHILAIFFCLMTQSAFGQNASNFSLHDVIAAAIEHNPNQNANTLQVEAAQYDAQAAHKLVYLPTVSISGGLTRYQYSGGYGGSDLPAGVQSFGINYATAGVTATETIYDGGAGRHAALALKSQAEAIAAQYKSTNGLIEHNAGELARTVFQIFLSINSTKLGIQYGEIRSTELKTLIPLLQDAKDVRLTNILNGAVAQVNANLQDYENLKGDFKHVTYLELPDGLESLEEANEHMKKDLFPYLDIDHAIEVAKQQNQDYLAKLYLLEATKESTAAQRSRLTRPVVQLVVADTWEKYQYGAGLGPPSTSRDIYAGIQFSFSVVPGWRETLRAGENRVKALQANVNYQTDEFTYKIKSTFAKLHSNDQAIGEYGQNLQKDNEQLQAFMQQHTGQNAKLSKDDVDQYISLFNDFNSNIDHFYQAVGKALENRYTLEVNIGILFGASAPKFREFVP